MFLEKIFQTLRADVVANHEKNSLEKRMDALEREMEMLRKINRRLSFSLNLLSGIVETPMSTEEKRKIREILAQAEAV